MYLFFLFFFIFISIFLIFFILLQPRKGFNNTLNFNSKNNIKFFSGIGTNNFVTNIIGIFSFLFLLISIILCNINNRKMEPDFLWEDHTKNIIAKKPILDKKLFHSDIPH
ncbi:preprotein translocase subunit SecG [Buchnera aphidicola]|uniref:Protein-export membrane protein SecG n=1 Tax=Buchnera aphidicola str. USDA (Myzus persicae) TaxID=1009856 RepID=W0NZV2_BUCMP|nr:preprotein translocase subunit SecG [Buchnera aphidicola]AHG60009.1 Secg [Buchnera aphidicola str. USDA (Myzus persicae)]AHG60589.1 Secg [Buchnera aphidicola str. W106 (Myzus persicae)]AHG61162.1 Secg [Buchnera aphidicola str. G002 (Myzus persicae)]AHG61734.1 Secg [Buchnera aphidicola str. F009 (Myzus persicae)]WAI03306.1 MAG: preprotein translocase subunit SecG [Buchnera aphidicola (Myzus persicae)]